MEIVRANSLEETRMQPFDSDGEEAVKLARVLGKLESNVENIQIAVTELTKKFEAFDKRLTESEIKTKLSAAIVVLAVSGISGIAGFFIGK